MVEVAAVTVEVAGVAVEMAAVMVEEAAVGVYDWSIHLPGAVSRRGERKRKSTSQTPQELSSTMAVP